MVQALALVGGGGAGLRDGFNTVGAGPAVRMAGMNQRLPILLALALALALTVAASSALAGALGVLINMELRKDPKGRTIYLCTYQVQGRKVQVALERYCPQTLPFERQRR